LINYSVSPLANPRRWRLAKRDYPSDEVRKKEKQGSALQFGVVFEPRHFGSYSLVFRFYSLKSAEI
jgi:hypothetical protein